LEKDRSKLPGAVDMIIRSFVQCVLIMLLLVLASGLFLSIARAEDITFDQDQSLQNGGAAFWAQNPLAQTFTPSVDGQLAYLDINIYPWAEASVPATISIVNTVDGAPTGTVLGEVHVSSFMYWWNSFDFRQESVWLRAGTLYGIVLSNDDPSSDPPSDAWAVRWDSNPYSQGELWHSTPEKGWERYNHWGAAEDDASFRTWMIVPEPATIAMLFSATLGGLLWWRRR
jgi:hypothetical protein